MALVARLFFRGWVLRITLWRPRKLDSSGWPEYNTDEEEEEEEYISLYWSVIYINYGTDQQKNNVTFCTK